MSDLSIAALVIYFKCKYQELKKLCGVLFVSRLPKLLVTLKVFDSDKTLSLTNLGVMIILGKIATAAVLDWTTAATLMLALLSYNAKKVMRSKEKAAEAESSDNLKALEDKIQELNKAFAVSTMFKK
jgi:hypothetical protein